MDSFQHKEEQVGAYIFYLHAQTQPELLKSILDRISSSEKHAICSQMWWPCRAGCDKRCICSEQRPSSAKFLAKTPIFSVANMPLTDGRLL